MDFTKTPVAGNGNLLIPGMQSPNFSALAGTGWQINRDGSATFYSISLPNFPGSGTKVTFAGTAPPSPAVGDVWYDTSQGLLAQQWDGTAWVPYSIGTQAIAGNAITPALQALGDTVNPNPYFAGGDTSNWNTTAGVLTLTGVPTSGAIAYPYAGEITVSAGASFPGMIGTFFAANAGDPVQVNGWFSSNADLQFGIEYYDNSFNFLGIDKVIVPAGTWQYAQIAGTAVAGTTQAVLAVLVNNGSATGSEVFDATGLTVLTKIQGGLIEANTVTASQIEAGVVLAGAVDGTTITGAEFVGTNFIENQDGLFFYSPSPGAGNLVASITGASGGTDPYGNTYQPGISVYGASGSGVNLVPSGSNTAIAFTPGVTPAPIPGVTVGYGSSSGTLQVIDGQDQATYGTARRTLILGSNSGTLTSLSTIFTSKISPAVSSARSYRIHGQLYINGNSGAQVNFNLAAPGGTTGEFGYSVCRASTLVGCVTGTPNTAAGVAVSLAAATGYIMLFDGVINVSTAGNFNFQVGSITGTGLVVAANSFIDIMPV